MTAPINFEIGTNKADFTLEPQYLVGRFNHALGREEIVPLYQVRQYDLILVKGDWHKVETIREVPDWRSFRPLPGEIVEVSDDGIIWEVGIYDCWYLANETYFVFLFREGTPGNQLDHHVHVNCKYCRPLTPKPTEATQWN